MVNVMGKHCTRDSCTRRPNFNFQGSKIGVYCKQHAAQGMVNVCYKHCSYDLCIRRASFSVEGSRTPVFCKRHAQDGMVDVRTVRSLNDCRQAKPAKDIRDNIGDAAPTRHYNTPNCSISTSDSSSEVVDCPKRPKLELEGQNARLWSNHGPFKGKVVHTMAMDQSTMVLDTPSSCARQRHLNGDTVATSGNQPHRGLLETSMPIPDGHRSGELVKTEMEVVLLV